MYKNKSGFINIFLTLGIFAIVAIGGYFLIIPPKSPVTPSPTPPPAPSAITVEGKITCLPKVGLGPHTLECAIGMQSASGLYYGLKNLFEHDPNHKLSETGSNVKVSGTFTAKEASDVYDITGYIDVDSIVLVSRPAPIPPQAPTPPPGVTEERITLREGERNGPIILEKVFSTYITGQIYREYPVATDQGSPITLQIGESTSNGCTVTMTLVSVSTTNKTATFIKKSDFNRPCPICLSEGTLISTPNGEIAIEELKAGMSVWTTDLSGTKVAAKILLASSTPTPIGHEVAHITLEDGRKLYASPLHPTADGRLAGKLMKGEVLDGSRVTNIEMIPYAHTFTYDILPAGATGTYFANGILMGSTLLGN